jgi:hypothetical protein
MGMNRPAPPVVIDPPRRERATRRPASGRAQSPPPDREVLEVVRAAAALRRGLALLHRAPVECASILLRVDVRLVERARSALEQPSTREALLKAFVGAAGRAGVVAAASGVGVAPRPRDAEELIRHAERRAGGLPLLRSAALEPAAVAFGVRPDVVLGARALLERRGVSREDPEGP